jgi:polar amino acid transport system substrate-binding protein
MYVGVIENEPWVKLSERAPAGVEPELVRSFAEELDAEIEWVQGPESELMEAMRGFQLDLVIGGLTRSSPYAREVALTRPYVDTQIELAVPRGEEVPDDLSGVEIWALRNSEEAALLREEEEEAEAVLVEELEQVDGLALLHDYDADAIGFEGTDHIFRDEEHAMAAPMGENAFLVELENFLLDRGEEARELLEREARR